MHKTASDKYCLNICDAVNIDTLKLCMNNENWLLY